jgi:hypothetical protein
MNPNGFALEMGGWVVNSRLAEFRTTTFGDNYAQVVGITIVRLGIKEDLSGTGAMFRSLNEHFHGNQLVDPVDRFHWRQVHGKILKKLLSSVYASWSIPAWTGNIL